MTPVIVIFSDPEIKPVKGLTNWEPYCKKGKPIPGIIRVLVPIPRLGSRWHIYHRIQVFPIA